MFRTGNRTDVYADVKSIFTELMLPKKKEFDIKWLKDNLHLIKKAFINKPGLHVYIESDKNKSNFILSIDGLILEEDRFSVGSGDFCLPLSIYESSHGYLEIGKGVGSMYAMHIYSKRNTPSKLSLAFYNI